MANKRNKYGRQVFLTRKDVLELRGLVDSALIGCGDFLAEVNESLEWAEGTSNEDSTGMWEAEKTETERRKAFLLNLKDKLWYYVDEDEINA